MLKRGQPLTAENQLASIKRAAQQIAQLVPDYQIILAHGNGPQIGLLSLQSAGSGSDKPYSLDLLGAETDGMIGYLLEQELSNLLPPDKVVATLLTRVEVSAADPAFLNPSKPIGAMYKQAEAEQIAAEKHWVVRPDGDGFRRVVASPKPVKIVGIEPILWLLEHHVIVIACGGGGIPVVMSADGHTRTGVDAVIDKDLCSALLAEKVSANMLLIVTDVNAVFLDWGTPAQRAIRKISPNDLSNIKFPDGSMGPKVEAACQFARLPGNIAVIGSLDQIIELVAGTAGTRVSMDCGEPVYS